MNEQEKVRAAASGDQAAFGLLVEDYQDKVYHLALRMCGNEEDAWDIAQEAFWAAWRGLPSFRGESGFSTWLYRLTSNAAVDHLRRGKRQRGDISLDDPDTGPDPQDLSPGPQEQAESSELQSAVAAGLRRLSDHHRQVLTLRELRGLSYEEVGDILELDPGTVKSRISRARAALRKILLEDGNLSGYLPSNHIDTKKRRGSHEDM